MASFKISSHVQDDKNKMEVKFVSCHLHIYVSLTQLCICTIWNTKWALSFITFRVMYEAVLFL